MKDKTAKDKRELMSVHSQQRKPMLSMPGIKRSSDQDEYNAAYVEMLNALRRHYELTGDIFVKPIIDRADRALSKAR